MIPFVGPSYSLNTRKADVQRAVNLYPVTNEVAGGKSESYLQAVAGLDLFSDAENAEFTINDANGTSVNGQIFTLTITRAGILSSEVSVRWTASGQIFDGTNGFKRTDNLYSGIATFASAQTTVDLPFTLEVVTGSLFNALVTLSDPSRGAQIDDAIGTMQAVPVEGLLSHFETLASGNVYTVVGPDLTITPPASVGPSRVKWGTNGGQTGNTTSVGDGEFSASGIVGALTGRSWRVEGWFYFAGTTTGFNGNLFTLAGNGGSALIGLTVIGGGGSDALAYGMANNTGSGGGGVGVIGQRPAPNMWHHIGTQYNAVTGDQSVFIDGVTIGLLGTGVTMWSGFSFGSIQSGMNLRGTIDDLFYQLDPAVLYGATYAVPAASFMPPDPA